MYTEHFKLKERPFVHEPGQRFFTPNPGVAGALARLRHVMSARDAIAVVSGGPGTGKSALVEQALAGLPDRYSVARVDLRFGDPADLYGLVLAALDPDAPEFTPARAIGALRGAMKRLAGDGRQIVLCLDIGGITVDVARHLLRITNLAGDHGGQMNVVLMGPHSIHQQVDIPALIQLRQRIGFRYRVRPFTLAETDRYIREQLEAAGAGPGAVLSNNVSAAVYCYVAGVPRLINTLADAMLGDACLQQIERPDGSLVKRAAEALGWKPLAPQSTGEASPPTRAAPRPATLRVAVASVNNDTIRTSSVERSEQVSLANEERSPTAAIFGNGEVRKPSGLPPPPVPMDSTDTGATGMLRLQDLDERFAETVFGENNAAVARKLGTD